MWTIYADEALGRTQMAWFLPVKRRVHPGTHPDDRNGAPLVSRAGKARLNSSEMATDEPLTMASCRRSWSRPTPANCSASGSARCYLSSSPRMPARRVSWRSGDRNTSLIPRPWVISGKR